MSTRDALLAAVLAAPDDDIPRLVFADFEDEHGDPARAAFIRLEVEAERHPAGSLERAELEGLAAELYNRHVVDWLGELPEWALKDQEVGVSFRRGFADELRVDYARFQLKAHELFAVAPITRVQLVYRGGRFVWREINRPAFLRRVTGLRLFLTPDCPASADLRDWQEARDLCDVRSLDVSSNYLGDDWLTRFVRRFQLMPFSRTLVELDLSGNMLTDDSAASLAAAGGFENLERLDLSYNSIRYTGRRLLYERFGDRVRL